MKVKTSELTGAALDWAVMHCEVPENSIAFFRRWYELASFKYSSDWRQGGPIIEREGIDLNFSACEGTSGEEWDAACEVNRVFGGPTLLVAAMRCYVASKLGDEVDVPDELMES